MSDFITEDQRLVILRSLADYNGELGESVLQDCLDDYGHRVSRDTVHTHIAWLAEQGLVRKRVLINGYFIAELTGRGQDVAEGRASVPGVKKPRARGVTMDKPTRGRVRKVDLLPDSIRKPLLEMLREKRLTQVQIREEINRLIREAGLPEEQQLSPAAISREASRNELIARNLRDLREQTKAMMAELGDKPTGETTALILEMSRALMYRRLRAATESLNSDSDVDMRLIKDILLSAQRAESAAERSIKREKEIRSAFAEEMANAVTDELRGVDGMSEQLESRIKGILLGKA